MRYYNMSSRSVKAGYFQKDQRLKTNDQRLTTDLKMIKQILYIQSIRLHSPQAFSHRSLVMSLPS